MPVDSLLAPPGTLLEPVFEPNLLGGVTVLRGELTAARTPPWDGDTVYRAQPPISRVAATLVPYAVWDNRAAGAMAVWLPQAPPLPRVGGPELAAAIQLSFGGEHCDPEGLRDDLEPKNSGDTPAVNCHFWPHKGGTEWAQYAWTEPRELAGCRVYWFDAEGHGECRLPAAARLSYCDAAGTWRPVTVVGAPLPIARDRWCEVAFAAVAATALRLEVDQREGFASGVLGWQVVPAVATGARAR